LKNPLYRNRLEPLANDYNFSTINRNLLPTATLNLLIKSFEAAHDNLMDNPDENSDNDIQHLTMELNTLEEIAAEKSSSKRSAGSQSPLSPQSLTGELQSTQLTSTQIHNQWQSSTMNFVE